MTLKSWYAIKHQPTNQQLTYIDTYMSAFLMKWLSPKEVDTVIWVQILDEPLCISHSANTLRKGMIPTILPPAMDK